MEKCLEKRKDFAKGSSDYSSCKCLCAYVPMGMTSMGQDFFQGVCVGTSLCWNGCVCAHLHVLYMFVPVSEAQPALALELEGPCFSL